MHHQKNVLFQAFFFISFVFLVACNAKVAIDFETTKHYEKKDWILTYVKKRDQRSNPAFASKAKHAVEFVETGSKGREAK